MYASHRLFAVCVVVLCVSCSGGGGGGRDVLETEAETLDSAGGRVALSMGASVEVPAGALTQPTLIAVESLSSEMVRPPDGMRFAGQPIAFTPHGLSFSALVTVRLPFSGELQEPVILRLDDGQDTTWETLEGGVFEDGIATLSISGFSIYVAADRRPASSGFSGSGGNGSGGSAGAAGATAGSSGAAGEGGGGIAGSGGQGGGTAAGSGGGGDTTTAGAGGSTSEDGSPACLERIALLRAQAEGCGPLFDGENITLETLCRTESSCPTQVDAYLACIEANGVLCDDWCADGLGIDVVAHAVCTPAADAYVDCRLGDPPGTSAQSSTEDTTYGLYDSVCL